jgi:hypothetical protein
LLGTATLTGAPVRVFCQNTAMNRISKEARPTVPVPVSYDPDPARCVERCAGHCECAHRFECTVLQETAWILRVRSAPARRLGRRVGAHSNGSPSRCVPPCPAVPPPPLSRRSRAVLSCVRPRLRSIIAACSRTRARCGRGAAKWRPF